MFYGYHHAINYITTNVFTVVYSWGPQAVVLVEYVGRMRVKLIACIHLLLYFQSVPLCPQALHLYFMYKLLRYCVNIFKCDGFDLTSHLLTLNSELPGNKIPHCSCHFIDGD